MGPSLSPAGASGAEDRRVPQRDGLSAPAPSEAAGRGRRGLPEGDRGRSHVLVALQQHRPALPEPERRRAGAGLVHEGHRDQSEPPARHPQPGPRRAQAQAIRSGRHRLQPDHRDRSVVRRGPRESGPRPHRSGAAHRRLSRASGRGEPRSEPRAGAGLSERPIRARDTVLHPMMMTDALKSFAVALILTLFAALAATAQEGRSPAAPVSDVDLAVAAFRAGRHAEALAAARRAAHASPTAGRALTTRASIAEFMGEFDEARTFYDKAAALTPDAPALIYRQASYALRVGEYDRALAQLDRLLALHPRQVRWLFQYAPTRLQAQLLRENPSLEHIVQTKIDILMEKGDLAQARRLAQGYAIVQPGQDYCGQARAVMAGRNREDVFKAFRLATLGQPDAADCIWWYGQWLSDEGYVLLGRVMVIEGSRVTGSAPNRESGAPYVRIRLGGNRDVPKRAEQLFLIARQRYLRDGDLEGAQRLFDECIRLAPGF